ncbi:hypothetical protein HDU67_003497 [Dinochytrium kinnereticum]|nr:hypothetical protein HDU67_003497 [Dinochytrium kinnereticum]
MGSEDLAAKTVTSLFNSFASTSPDIRAHVLKRILDECTRTEISFVQKYAQVRASSASRGREDASYFSCSDGSMLSVEEAQINDLTHRLALIPSPWGRQLKTHQPLQSRPQTTPPTLSSLADEILLQIFYHVNDPTSLATSAQVCRKWGTLIRDNLLWRSFCVRNGFGPLRPWCNRAGTASENGGPGAGHRSSMHGATSNHRRSPYMGRRRRDRWPSASRMEAMEAASGMDTSRGHHGGLEILNGRGSRKHSNDVHAVGSSQAFGTGGVLKLKRSGSSGRIRMWQLPSLAPWKAIYKQNYMTHLNWKRGRYIVKPATSFAGLEGKLCMQFDENWVVSVALGEDGRIWDLQTGHCHMRLIGHNGIISAVKFDRKYVVSGGVDATIKIWDAATGECLRTLRGHDGEIVSVQYNQTHVVSASEDKTIRFDGGRIASGSTDETIKLWSLDSNDCVGTLLGHRGSVYCVQLRENTLCSGSEDCSIKIWDIERKACVRTLTGHMNGVVCIQFDESKLVSGSADKTAKVWDIKSGACLYTLMQHTGTVWNLTFTPSKLITSSFDQSLLVWDFTFTSEEDAGASKPPNLSFDRAKSSIHILDVPSTCVGFTVQLTDKSRILEPISDHQLYKSSRKSPPPSPFYRILVSNSLGNSLSMSPAPSPFPPANVVDSATEGNEWGEGIDYVMHRQPSQLRMTMLSRFNSIYSRRTLNSEDESDDGEDNGVEESDSIPSSTHGAIVSVQRAIVTPIQRSEVGPASPVRNLGTTVRRNRSSAKRSLQKLSQLLGEVENFEDEVSRLPPSHATLQRLKQSSPLRRSPSTKNDHRDISLSPPRPKPSLTPLRECNQSSVSITDASTTVAESSCDKLSGYLSDNSAVLNKSSSEASVHSSRSATPTSLQLAIPGPLSVALLPPLQGFQDEMRELGLIDSQSTKDLEPRTSFALNKDVAVDNMPAYLSMSALFEDSLLDSEAMLELGTKPSELLPKQESFMKCQNTERGEVPRHKSSDSNVFVDQKGNDAPPVFPERRFDMTSRSPSLPMLPVSASKDPAPGKLLGRKSQIWRATTSKSTRPILLRSPAKTDLPAKSPFEPGPVSSQPFRKPSLLSRLLSRKSKSSKAEGDPKVEGESGRRPSLWKKIFRWKAAYSG